MKEIDFLPSWYKNDRRQQFTYRTQYVALGGIFVLMLVSNFVTSRSISKAQAELNRVELMGSALKNTSAEFTRISGEIAGLRGEADVLKKIDSRINVADILAELSFLVGNKIVLTRVEFIAENFSDAQKANTGGEFSVRPAAASGSDQGRLSWGNVRFKVILNGVAAGTSGVGEFVCRLEDSPYFCRVYPLFSRNRQVKTGTGVSGRAQNSAQNLREGEEGVQVSEFEIGCYLANYTEN